MGRAISKPTVPQCTDDELGAQASAGNGQVYGLTGVSSLGNRGLDGGGYTVYFMPVGTTAEKMRDNEIGEAPALEKAKAIAEKHFAKRQ